MGKAIRASALILLLTCTARAGWMGNDSPVPTPQRAGWMGNGSPEPSPQPASAAQEQATDGEITTMSAGSLTQIALDMLAVLPSLL